MAYSATNPPNKIVEGTIDGTGGPTLWAYASADTDAVTRAAGYFSDALLRGMVVGDIIFIYNNVTFNVTEMSVASFTGNAANLRPVQASVLGTEVATALNTVGAGTITAAGIAGMLTTRGGAQAGAAFTDTSDTAANIIAAIPGAALLQSFEWTYQNNTNGLATLTGGTGVTLAAVVPGGQWARFLVTYATATTVTFTLVATGSNATLPVAQFVSISAGNGTLAAGNMEGAAFCTLASSGATAMTTRTAAQLIAAIPGWQIGDTYMLRVFNSNAGTLTLTGGTGVTITGTATIATSITRDYMVSMTAAATVTMQNLGSGVAN